ncbi:hypothetical protein [Marinimicrobium sp. LS-A18]|uniref:hypothetical protein n=1 Tax=Marinimicrobium sp. LS-A18 TaxID=1381596 RepID=UPI0004644E07|nr:hypothetical protein [Marinimicrobium sp. LS-A18]
MDKILSDANGDLTLVKQKLGIPEKYWNEEIIRIDIHNPLLHNARLPSGLERGANEQFKWGGYTSGGLPEIVIDQVPQEVMIDSVKLKELTISNTGLK